MRSVVITGFGGMLAYSQAELCEKTLRDITHPSMDRVIHMIEI
jgi:hypothetical protein